MRRSGWAWTETCYTHASSQPCGCVCRKTSPRLLSVEWWNVLSYVLDVGGFDHDTCETDTGTMVNVRHCSSRTTHRSNVRYKHLSWPFSSSRLRYSTAHPSTALPHPTNHLINTRSAQPLLQTSQAQPTSNMSSPKPTSPSLKRPGPGSRVAQHPSPDPRARQHPPPRHSSPARFGGTHYSSYAPRGITDPGPVTSQPSSGREPRRDPHPSVRPPQASQHLGGAQHQASPSYTSTRKPSDFSLLLDELKARPESSQSLAAQQPQQEPSPTSGAQHSPQSGRSTDRSFSSHASSSHSIKSSSATCNPSIKPDPDTSLFSPTLATSNASRDVVEYDEATARINLAKAARKAELEDMLIRNQLSQDENAARAEQYARQADNYRLERNRRNIEAELRQLQ